MHIPSPEALDKAKLIAAEIQTLQASLANYKAQKTALKEQQKQYKLLMKGPSKTRKAKATTTSTKTTSTAKPTRAVPVAAQPTA